MNSAVQIVDFSRSYGSVPAVKTLTLNVREGELFGLIGPDGAGKTTVLRALCGLIGRDSGTMSVFGIDPVREPRKLRESIGYMPQRFSLYPDLTVAENLRFFADLYLVSATERRQREERLMQFSRLAPFRDRRASDLSGGMKQKLALSCTLIHTPKLLILDEPTTGVDPVSRREFWAILKELAADGITLIVSTPYMDEALLCHRIALMNKGSALAVGTTSEITTLYPYTLVEAIADDLQKLRRLLVTHGLALNHLHRFGSKLHVSCSNSEEVKLVTSKVSQYGGSARVTEPSIEDTFVALLDNQKTVNPTQP